MNQTHRTFIMKILPHLIPAGLVALGVVYSLTSQAPVLEALPERLSATVLATEEPEVSSVPQISELPVETLLPEETPTLLAGIGNYTDGVYTGSATGYGGTVSVQVTVEGGQITDITILSAEKETASFFQRAKGVISSILIAQTWEVDGVSGATYSSNGIKYAVKNALTGQVTSSSPATATSTQASPPKTVTYVEPSAYQDGTYTGSAQGFGGTITVQVVIQNGKIMDLTIVSASGETPSYLARAKSLLATVVEKQTPNVDTVSGATYSSAGILNAAKQALSKAAGEAVTEDTPVPSEALTPEVNPTPEETPVSSETPAETPSPSDAVTETSISSNVYSASALCSPDGSQQFTAYMLGVSVTVDTTITTITQTTAEGTEITTRTTNAIREVQLLSPDSSSSNWLFLQWAMNGNGSVGVFSQILSQQSADNIDAVSMATCSSRAIAAGVRSALDSVVLGTQEETVFLPTSEDLDVASSISEEVSQ